MVLYIVIICQITGVTSIFIYNLDNNECLSGNNTCGNNTNCVNNPGNYSCPCNVGFTPVSNLTNTCTGNILFNSRVLFLFKCRVSFRSEIKCSLDLKYNCFNLTWKHPCLNSVETLVLEAPVPILQFIILPSFHPCFNKCTEIWNMFF